MKKSIKTMLGVTLLEIMLVLAIAAMVIVLSIKYYQSATNSSQTNAIMGSLQSITAAADNLAQATGSYKDVTQPQLGTILPASAFISPWGTTMTYTSSSDGSSFTVTVPGTAAAVCTLVLPKLKANSHSSGSTCDSSTTTSTLSYIFLAN